MSIIKEHGNYLTKRSFLEKIHLDPLLMLGVILVIALGLITVYSASGGDFQVTKQQGYKALFALGAMILVAQIPPRKLITFIPWLFSIGLIMLLAVLLIGDVSKGAQRWLDFGFIRFQPSEGMKLLLPIMIAWLFAFTDFPAPITRFIVGIILTATTSSLIFMQPDLGSAILIAMTGIFVLFFAGLPWKIIITSLTTIAISTPIAWNFLHSYQKQRILTFLNPELDPLGSGYHIIQSKIAIGSGGLAGKGFLGSTQAHLEFLPESTTDFIFSVFAEEFGLISVALLLLIYALILLRGLYISYRAKDHFSRLVAASLTMTLFIYVTINIAMVSGVFPVTGLPLPLISYGGSSMITLMISFGILMSIHTHEPYSSTG